MNIPSNYDTSVGSFSLFEELLRAGVVGGVQELLSGSVFDDQTAVHFERYIERLSDPQRAH